MPATMHRFTSDDYWALPEGRRAELIDGELYDMAPPSWEHQGIVLELARKLADFIDSQEGDCKVRVAPVAVNLFADDTTWLEPDVMVVCDPSKISHRGVVGAPDFIAEVVSPSSGRMDYLTKADRYARAGVREYWIVDAETRQTAVYRYEEGDVTPTFYPFSQPVPVGIWDGCFILVEECAG